MARSCSVCKHEEANSKLLGLQELLNPVSLATVLTYANDHIKIVSVSLVTVNSAENSATITLNTGVKRGISK